MAMRNLIEGLRSTGDPRDLQDAERVASMLEERGRDFSFSPDVAPEEAKLPPQEFRPFTDQERKALIKDGAGILSLIGESTAEEQPFRYTVDGRVLFELPPIRMDVAIYTERAKFPIPDNVSNTLLLNFLRICTNPKEFPIPNSGDTNFITQEELDENERKESQALRERLGIEDDSLRVIIPNPKSTLTELISTCLVGTPNEGKRIMAFKVGHTTLFNGNAKAADEAVHPFGRSTLGGVPDTGDYAVVLNRYYGFMGYGNSPVVRLVVARKN